MLSITSYEGTYSEPFTIEIQLEQASQVAAGDFKIQYDSSKLNVQSIEALYTSSYFMHQNIPSEGKINLSIVESSELDDADKLFAITLHAVSITEPLTTSILITGKDVVNQAIEAINLDYIGGVIELAKHYHTIQFQDYDGNHIESKLVKEGAIPQDPPVTPRENTVFDRWSKTLIEATISNENYDAQIIPGTLTVIAYDWIYGNLNFDQTASVYDTTLIQLYLAELITFHPI